MTLTPLKEQKFASIHGDTTEGRKLKIFGDGSAEINSHETSGS
jgi:hypothetical protein